ncbi:hypothetical protein, partial [Kineosporia sp. A_224]|uniref:hypothetical protein n=1 Tax=Kineosporia sp. A_224 TaxID=1962180 RepID=UPI0018E9C1BF
AGRVALRAAPAATPAALPDGWSLADGGTTLRWTSPTPLPLGGARLDVVAGGAVLGAGRLSPDRRTVSLAVDAGAVKDLSSLQLVAAGRRLDAGPTAVAASSSRASALSRKPSAATVPSPAATAQSALPAAADPGRPGPYRTRTGEYTLADLPVTGLPVPVEMTAVVVAPVGASGKRPLALFLHGRHEPCYFVDGDPDTFPDTFWPCPAGWAPVPSYRGYLQSQELLASQGWLTVSVSANGINAQDFAADDGGALARSELVRAHLARWASWAASDAAWASAPDVVRAGPRPNLSKVLLVGHSRGGEGVNRAAVDSALDPAARWKVKGQLLLAPTAFGRNPAPGVPTAVVLPYCDGDVFDLQGQDYLDDARDLATDRSLRSAVLVLGANHNFFNTEWTPGESVAPSFDDWFGDEDPTCGATAPGRLSPAEQRAVGATYVAAAARVLVGRDTKTEPLLDGSAVRAPSAGRAVVLTHALGARRDALLRPGATSPVTATGTVRARLCDTEATDPGRLCVNDDTLFGATPHFPLDFFGVGGAPVRQVVEVGWSRRGGAARVRLAGPVSVAGDDTLALRVVAPPNAARARFGVRLVDADGTRLTLGEASVTGLPGGSDPATQMPGKYWGQEVRVRIDAKKASAAGLDLRKVVAVEVLPRSATGKVWVLDAWGRRPGLAADRKVPFLRVDVGRLTVEEGDAGTRDVRLPITVTGRIDRTARVWLGSADFGTSTLPAGLPKVVRIAPGTRHLDVTVPVVGNTLDDEDLLQVPVFARGVRNAVGGDWIGALSIADDDPSPDVTITPAATAVEGGSLVWTVTLSAPSNRFVSVDMLVRPVAAPGRELDSDDVPEDWLLGQTGLEARPVPAVPLSDLDLFLGAFVEPGATTGTVEIPVAADATVEGAEQVSLRVPAPDEPFPGYPGTPGLPSGADLTGTVTDGP